MSETGTTAPAGRLLVRLTLKCNSGCAHCTIADIAHHPEPGTEQVWKQIVDGHQRGCRELVFMRGEPTLRKDLVPLTRNSRKLGYTHIQVQTNARMLSYPRYVDKLLRAGMSFFEVSLFGHNAWLHDAVDGTEGAFVQASAGLRNLVERGAALMVTVPIVKRNYLSLSDIVRYLHDAGVGRVQLNFSRPVQVGPQWVTQPLVRLSDASPHIRKALRLAAELGMVGETEAVPLCHLDPDARGADIEEDFARHSVADVHRNEASMADHRETSRPRADACDGCVVATRCPRTWVAYQMLYGTWEFAPIRGWWQKTSCGPP